MIKKLKLRNFQNHRKRILVFGPGITSITGSTDAGKSAVLRAIRWLLLNDKPGAGFIRRGGKFASVTALLNAGTLRRLQGAARNEYRMSGQVFKSFGASVPDPIKKALAVSEINFQGQHDAPFWFSLSAGEVSRQLNAVIDLSVIDEALAKVSAALRSASERKRIAEENLTQVKEELNALAAQRKRKDEFIRLSKEHEAIETLNENCHQLSTLADRLHSHRLSRASEKAQQGAGVLQLGGSAIEIEDEVTTLQNGLRWIRVAEEKLVAAVTRAGEAVVEFEEATKDQLCPICKRPLPS